MFMYIFGLYKSLFMLFFLFLMIPRPPKSSLFPYPTLFRSAGRLGRSLGPLAMRTRQLLNNGSRWTADRKSTRLNSSNLVISYAVFCLKKKNTDLAAEAGAAALANAGVDAADLDLVIVATITAVELTPFFF